MLNGLSHTRVIKVFVTCNEDSIQDANSISLRNFFRKICLS